MTLGRGCPVHCGRVSSIPGPHPLAPVNSLPDGTTTDASRRPLVGSIVLSENHCFHPMGLPLTELTV